MQDSNFQTHRVIQERQVGTADAQQAKELIDVQPPKGVAFVISNCNTLLHAFCVNANKKHTPMC